MRDVRNKFLAGIVERADAGQHLVECVRDQLCLEVIRNRNAFVEIAVGDVLDGTGDLLERLHQNAREQIAKDQHEKRNDRKNRHSLRLQNFHIRTDLIRRNADEHNAERLLRLGILNPHRHFQIVVFPVVLARLLALKALDDLLRDNRLSAVHIVRIFDDAEILVNNQDSAAVDIRQHTELSVDDIRSRIFHVILLDELVADNIALIFYGNAAHRYRTVLIAVYDALLKDHTRYNADDHKNHRDAEAQTPQKLPFFFDFKPGNSNQLPTLCERTSVHLDFSRSFRADGGYVHLRCARRPGTHSPRQCSAGSLCCTPCSD